MSTPTIPVGNAYPSKNPIVLSSDLNVNIGLKAYYTGSVANGSQCLNKSILVYFSGASSVANSLGPNSGSVTVWYSYDNTSWNTGISNWSLLSANIGTLGWAVAPTSGSFSSAQTWYSLSFNYLVPYMRIYAYNGSGSAVSGSIIILGYI